MESASALKKWYLYVNLLFEIKLSTGELMLFKCSVRDYAWESLGQQGNPTSPFLKEISPEFSLETPIFWLPDVKNWLIWKDPDAGKDWRKEEKGMTKDEKVEWHHRLNGHKF